MAAGGEPLAEQPPYEVRFAGGRSSGVGSRPCHCGRTEPPAV